ncbi:MAG TPA: uridine kinase [Cyclobacteriaceae bacterium]|nr:uridine kinase [Cyclobacteriaceae bacterium]
MKTPFTISITGGSGSGKTYFLKELSSKFRKEDICLVSQDNYYRERDLQPVDEEGHRNFDLPESLNRELFSRDIQRLRNMEVVEKEEYTFNNPNVTPRMLVFKPAPILIIEGLFVQYFPEIAQQIDLKIFIEAKDHVKLSRRIRRDNTERGYDLDDVLYRYQNHVMPVYETLIEPLKHKADMIIPNNEHFSHALPVLQAFMRQLIDDFGTDK